jgi:hypothetical protein
MAVSSLFSVAALVRLLVVLVVATISDPGRLGAQDQSYDLVTQQLPGQYFQVQAQFQHRGTVVVENTGEDPTVHSLPLKVDARFEFVNRIAGKKGSLQSIRFYEQALANISLDKGQTTTKLSPSNRTIVARLKPNRSPRLQLASIQDSLQQSEFELLNNPIDPLSFPSLFTTQKRKLGEKWEASRDALAGFLAVDRVIESDVKLKLHSVTEKIAKIYVMGKLSADVNDVSTEMQLSGIATIDLDQNFVTGIRLNIKEDRQPGQVAPGFTGDTKIAMKIATSSSIPELSNATLASHSKSRSLRSQLKWESPEFLLTYDPSWRLIASESDAAILRYIDNGELLAQCNIVKIASRPATNLLSLDEFKKEVEKIMKSDGSARLIDARQSRNSHGHQALQVSVQAEEEGIPLNWIYYNVSHSDGRQVTFVFTLEQEIADRALPAIGKIVDGFRFMPRDKKQPATRDANARQATKR